MGGDTVSTAPRGWPPTRTASATTSGAVSHRRATAGSDTLPVNAFATCSRASSACSGASTCDNVSAVRRPWDAARIFWPVASTTATPTPRAVSCESSFASSVSRSTSRAGSERVGSSSGWARDANRTVSPWLRVNAVCCAL